MIEAPPPPHPQARPLPRIAYEAAVLAQGGPRHFRRLLRMYPAPATGNDATDSLGWLESDQVYIYSMSHYLAISSYMYLSMFIYIYHFRRLLRMYPPPATGNDATDSLGWLESDQVYIYNMSPYLTRSSYVYLSMFICIYHFRRLLRMCPHLQLTTRQTA